MKIFKLTKSERKQIKEECDTAKSILKELKNNNIEHKELLKYPNCVLARVIKILNRVGNWGKYGY